MSTPDLAAELRACPGGANCHRRRKAKANAIRAARHSALRYAAAGVPNEPWATRGYARSMRLWIDWVPSETRCICEVTP